MNYNEIYFNYHRSSYAEKLPGMLLSQVAINIFRMGSIIRVQFSGWQLFGGTYQQSIILRGNSLSANCPRDNYLADIFRGSNFWGAIVRSAIIRGAIIWGKSCCSRYIRIRIIFVSTDCSFHFALKGKISVSASSPLTIKHKVNHNSIISISGITP